jgi:hypothetical protein
MHCIHKQNLNEKKVLGIPNNLNECLICASTKNGSTDSSKQGQMTEGFVPCIKHGREKDMTLLPTVQCPTVL